MTDEMIEKIYSIMIEKIYSMLTRQKFADWYKQDFVDHISFCGNAEECKTKEQIKADLQKMLGN